MVQKKILLYTGVVVVVLAIAGGMAFSRSTGGPGGKDTIGISQPTVSDTSEQAIPAVIERQATVYKEATCGCCLGYVAELKKQGFTVDVKSLGDEDMTAVKERYGISEDKQSCHTTIIGDYFIEGHVPIEAVEKLLIEKPKIAGIGLPGMPLGTPGMPGVKQVPYEIYEKAGDTFSEFMKL
ncbi:MAG: DUF411 domain-containing protein [Candidatus Moranbacteria bacterium]|nr:DUF411 domain-containing protein [Candidatus Moranbacteria bacterium]